jgi:hypothetical protein
MVTTPAFIRSSGSANWVSISMREVWLRPNRRILATWAVTSLVLLAVCVVIAVGWIPGLDGVPARIIAGILAVLAVFAVVIFAWLLGQPRLAYSEGHLLVYLGGPHPIAVPIEFVEAFLLGQGPSWLTGKKHHRTETITLAVRLADRAVDWSHRSMHPMLGSWCDGYFTIRGTWCEPLSVELVNRLNQRLYEVTRARKHDETVGQRA